MVRFRVCLISDTTSPSWNKPQSQELVTNIFLRKGRRVSVENMKVNIELYLFSIIRVCDKLLWLSLEEMHRVITLSEY